MGNAPPKEDKKKMRELKRQSRATVMKEFEPHCIAEVLLEPFKRNIKRLKNAALKDGGALSINLACNAYGHGAVECGKLAVSVGVDCFAVSTLKEGIDIREGGLGLDKAKIVVLSEPAQMELPGYSAFGLGILVSSKKMADMLLDWASAFEGRRKLLSYVLVDTGTTGLGVRAKDVVKVVNKLTNRSKTVKFCGLCLRTVDDRVDAGSPRVDLNVFYNVVRSVYAKGLKIPSIIMEYNPNLLYDWSCKTENFEEIKNTSVYVRCGPSVYGYPSKNSQDVSLKSCLSLKGQVRDIRQVSKGGWIGLGEGWEAHTSCDVAVISTGFADGYPRVRGKERRHVRINGETYNIVGEIAMNQMLVLLKDKHNVKIGDYAVLFGPEDDDIHNMQLSAISNTCQIGITEILCSISARVSRQYKSTGLTRRKTKMRLQE